MTSTCWSWERSSWRGAARTTVELERRRVVATRVEVSESVVCDFLGQYGSLDILLEREILTLHLDGANE